jgi:hypothetical protein
MRVTGIERQAFPEEPLSASSFQLPASSKKWVWLVAGDW